MVRHHLKPYTFSILSMLTAQAKNCKRVCLANAKTKREKKNEMTTMCIKS